jgi:hypothetical protein
MHVLGLQMYPMASFLVAFLPRDSSPVLPCRLSLALEASQPPFEPPLVKTSLTVRVSLGKQTLDVPRSYCLLSQSLLLAPFVSLIILVLRLLYSILPLVGPMAAD